MTAADAALVRHPPSRPGIGPGAGSGLPGGKEDGKGAEVTEGKGELPGKENTLRVEMIPSTRYKEDGRYYLVEGKDVRHVALEQVEQELELQRREGD